MPLSNCSRCGKTFNRSGAKVCPACVALEDEQFDRVYQYVRDNPGIPIPALAAQTEVPERLILDWFRTKRLLSRDDSVQWECERCGSAIRAGRLCLPCANELQASIQESSGQRAESPQPPPDGPPSPQVRGPDIGHQLRSDKYAR